MARLLAQTRQPGDEVGADGGTTEAGEPGRAWCRSPWHRQCAGPRLVVLDGRSTPCMHVTASAMLVLLRPDGQRMGAELVLAEDIGQVRTSWPRPSRGRTTAVPTIEAAVASFTENG